MSRSFLALGLGLVLAGGGCAGASRLAYRPDELRAEVARRAPAIPPGEVVVPFEITEAQAEMARAAAGKLESVEDRVRALVSAMYDPRFFALRYGGNATASAQDTLQAHEGNCLALASVFIGLARALGLQAYYMDASTRVHEPRYGADGMTVSAGHVTAVVRSGDDDIGLDFAQLGRIRWYRVLDDVEALAHFYNDRGFDLVEQSDGSGSPEVWTRAAHDFRRAVAVMPGFAPAWNNLGIADSRLGQVREAIEDYRRAIAHDARLAAPWNNLGWLYLQVGDGAAADEALEAAARLEPDGPHIQYNLALARLRQGDRTGARRAVERALELRRGYRQAQALLEELAPSAQ